MLTNEIKTSQVGIEGLRARLLGTGYEEQNEEQTGSEGQTKTKRNPTRTRRRTASGTKGDSWKL